MIKLFVLPIIVSISLYMAKYTSFSPIYFIYILASYIGILSLFLYRNLRLTLDVLLILMCSIILTVFHFEYMFTGTYINFILGAIGYSLLRIYSKYTFSMIVFFRYSIILSLILIILDTIYRLTNPGAPYLDTFDYYYIPEDRWFYLYKYNSILFRDSNTVALLILNLVFPMLIFNRLLFSSNMNMVNIMALIFFILLLLTFSRAGIIAFLFGIIFYFLYNRTKGIKLYLIVCLLFIKFLATVFIISQEDLSFQSKLFIYDMLLKYIMDKFYESQFITGIGLQKSYEILGIYTHALIATSLIEAGVVFFISYTAFLLYILIRYKNSKIILVPNLVASLSYFLYLGSPFFFVPLAIVINYEEITKRKNTVLN